MKTLFSLAYLPSISYLQKIVESGEIIFEKEEHFIKQTFRNRCNIYGANGKQTIVIPVVHENLFRIPIREVKISYDAPWNKIHWKAISSAYRNSPYFEYYEEDFKTQFEKPGEYLIDFNLKLFELILKIFNINKKIVFTNEYEKTPDSTLDLRIVFHPKNNQEKIKPYHQVFADRHGFINDLSCIDYLFNMGNKFSV